jgi:hypothetical protein
MRATSADASATRIGKSAECLSSTLLAYRSAIVAKNDPKDVGCVFLRENLFFYDRDHVALPAPGFLRLLRVDDGLQSVHSPFIVSFATSPCFARVFASAAMRSACTLQLPSLALPPPLRRYVIFNRLVVLVRVFALQARLLSFPCSAVCGTLAPSPFGSGGMFILSRASSNVRAARC